MCSNVVGTETLEPEVIDEAAVVQVTEADVNRLPNHPQADSSGAVGTTSMLNILECDHKLIATVLSQLDRVLGVLEVTKPDPLQTSVQPDDVGVTLALNADALYGRSTTVLGARKAEVRNLDLEHAGDEVQCIHGVFILFV